MAKGRNSFAKEKKTIIFDEDSRREYLLGFQKRKNKRRQKALDDLKNKEKEKIKEIKKKKKEEFMEHLKKQREELDALESDEENPEDDTSPVDATYDHPEHIVTVTTVCDVNLEESSTTIGYNKGFPEMKNSADSKVNKEKAKNKLFEKKIKKYSKTNKSQCKRSNNNKSTKFQPKKKRKK